MATVVHHVQTLDDLWQYMTRRFRDAEHEADCTATGLFARFHRYLPDGSAEWPMPFADLGGVFERFQVPVRATTELARSAGPPSEQSLGVPVAAAEQSARRRVGDSGDLTEWFDNWKASGFLILLGDPGVGKTWQSARLWHRAMRRYLPPSGNGVLPILLTAEELSRRVPARPPTSEVGRLRDVLHLPEHSASVPILLFLDGWDEVRETDQLRLLPLFRGRIQERGDVAVLLTSRPSKFNAGQFTQVVDREVWRLTALDANSPANGGEQLIRRWYAAVPGAEARGQLLVRRLRENRRVREMVQVPLLNVIFCKYWNTPKGDRLPDELPDSTAELIEEFIKLLLEQHQRDNRVDNITSFFGRVRTRLAAAAAGTFRGERWKVTEELLSEFGIAGEDWERLIGPLGLFTRVGVVEYEILHQVLAEWLTAVGLSKAVGGVAAFRQATRQSGDGVKMPPIRFFDRRWREVWKFLAQMVPDVVFEEWLRTLWAIHRRRWAGEAGAVWEPPEDVFDSAACLAGYLLAIRGGGCWLADRRNRHSVGHLLARRLFRMWERDRGGADVRAACVALVGVGYYRPILRPFRWRRWKWRSETVTTHAMCVLNWFGRMTGVSAVFGWLFIRFASFMERRDHIWEYMSRQTRIRTARRQHRQELREHDPRRRERCPGVAGMLRVAELLRDGGGDAAEFVRRVLPMLDDPREQAVNAAFSALGRVAAQAGDAAPALARRMAREYADFLLRTADKNTHEFSDSSFHGDWEKQILNVLIALGPNAAPAWRLLRKVVRRDNRKQKRSPFAIALVLLHGDEAADSERILYANFRDMWLEDSSYPDAPKYLDLSRHQHALWAALDRAEVALEGGQWPRQVSPGVLQFPLELSNSIRLLSMSLDLPSNFGERLLDIARSRVERAGVQWVLGGEPTAEDRERLHRFALPYGLVAACHVCCPTDERFRHLLRLLVAAERERSATFWRYGNLDLKSLRNNSFLQEGCMQEVVRERLLRKCSDGHHLADCCHILSSLGSQGPELIARLISLAEWTEWWHFCGEAACQALARLAPPETLCQLLSLTTRSDYSAVDPNPQFRLSENPSTERVSRRSCRKWLAEMLSRVGPVSPDHRLVLEGLLAPPTIPETVWFDDDPRVSLARAIGLQHLTDEHFHRLRTPARWWHFWNYFRPKGYRRLYLDWLRYKNSTLTKTGREVDLTAAD